MKSRELLSVVFSLIMFTGITAGTAFAESDEYDKTDYKKHDYDIREKLDEYCSMTDAEKADFISKHDKAEEHVAKMNEYCSLDESHRDAYIEEHKDDYKKHTDREFREKLDAYCVLSDVEKDAYIAEHDKTAEKAAKMDRYCTLDESKKADFISDNIDEYKAYMKDKMHDKIKDKHHMDYDRLCSLSETDLATEISDSEKLDKITDWCHMTPQEREDYNKDHMSDKMHDDKRKHCDGDDCPKDYRCDGDDCPTRMHDSNKMHDFDGMSDVAKEHMSDVAKDRLHDKMMFSDKSDRLKAMITDKRDISDERHDEIRMKYEEKHGDKGDKKRAELKIKFRDHMSKIEIKMTDERKSAIHDRLTDMKAFKAELRDRSSDITDEERQQLRTDFIEKAKDMQLAWISPRTQMHAGVDAAEVECKEGYSLVMKASNGVAMCLYADTALKMIDRGIVVPAI